MTRDEIVERIGGGRTDLVFDLLEQPGWRDALHEGPVRLLQWFVYHGRVTALKDVLRAGGNLSNLDLDEKPGNSEFFGHWRVRDLLLWQGTDRETRAASGSSPLTWASEHLRPARILALLTNGDHRISPAAIERNTSDHDAGWGNGMEWSLLGEYFPASVPRR